MSDRTLVLVAGSGRSGTSLFSGILQRLGMHVPQPEVPADESNPRGFAESQWVVDFHARQLRAAHVQVADARPAAWARTAEVSLRSEVEAELRRWLTGQFAQSPALVIKDPRLSWFLPLWQRVAEQEGASVRFVTMLRHPAAVVDSKLRWYGGRQDETARAAGWLNQTLFTERATREGRRAFVRYDDLLDDWVRTIGDVGDALDLAQVRDAPAPALRRVHEFVDSGLSRSRAGWDGLDVPDALREQAEAVWTLVSLLADGETSPRLTEGLDELRGAYTRYYAEAEAVATSSIVAAQRAAQSPAPPANWKDAAAGLVPLRYKRKVPPQVRARLRGAL